MRKLTNKIENIRKVCVCVVESNLIIDFEKILCSKTREQLQFQISLQKYFYLIIKFEIKAKKMI